ncbi:hypothetical protein J4G43_019960 [Bradyrhizobium barranii subsp. barranii]|uniref:Uncharacterized protein n=1 Tax=Bradyrhizobium barranii subsp. barranii TaxID=2823807 RepID=A0A939S3B7_9BRAD|nr:hypothetical protein [Bradyrhizobium barranii]UEM16291.1 hypothetical protein J4G43_019960 [Bradyrhizobium barranii subsp. barranii]
MKCLRIYATPDGESHFGEVEIPMTAKLTVAPGAKPFQVSQRYLASSMEVTQIPAGMRQVEWHTVPARVLTVRLTGAVEYETSDGEVRHVSAGEFVLVEDTHGKGHLSRHSPDEQTVLWIRLPNGLDLPPP